jgi:hypothetical protein
MGRTIKSIWGQEPRRDGEIPDGNIVGHDGVTRIDEREQNLGTYGIVWFDVYRGDVLVRSMNAIAISMVNYFDGDAP